MTPREDAIGLRRLEDLDPLIDRIGDARFVLLGEASHGTADFYRWRAGAVIRRRCCPVSTGGRAGCGPTTTWWNSPGG